MTFPKFYHFFLTSIDAFYNRFIEIVRGENNLVSPAPLDQVAQSPIRPGFEHGQGQ